MSGRQQHLGRATVAVAEHGMSSWEDLKWSSFDERKWELLSHVLNFGPQKAVANKVTDGR